MRQQLEYVWAGIVVNQATAEHFILQYEMEGERMQEHWARMLTAVMILQTGPDEFAQRYLSGWSVLTMRWMPRGRRLGMLVD